MKKVYVVYHYGDDGDDPECEFAYENEADAQGRVGEMGGEFGYETIPLIEHGSEKEWARCESCHTLVRKDRLKNSRKTPGGTVAPDDHDGWEYCDKCHKRASIVKKRLPLKRGQKVGGGVPIEWKGPYFIAFDEEQDPQGHEGDMNG